MLIGQNSEDKEIQAQMNAFTNFFLIWSGKYAYFSFQQQIREGNIPYTEKTYEIDELHQKWKNNWQQFSVNSERSSQKIKSVIFKTFKKELIFSFLITFLSYQSLVMTPLIIYFLSQYIKEGNINQAHNLIFLIFVIAVKILNLICTMHSEYHLKKIGQTIFSCICFAITDKSLKRQSDRALSNSHLSKLMQFDCPKIIEYPYWYVMHIIELYTFIFVLICVYLIAGVIGLLSCLIILLLQIVRYCMGFMFKQYKQQLNMLSSQRIQYSSQVIKRIKYIKANALQNYFCQQLLDKRYYEIKKHKQYLYLGIISIIFQSLASRIGILAFIALYSWQNDQTIPTSALAYLLLLFYNYIPLNRLIQRVTALEDIDVSLNKIEQFISRNNVENKNRRQNHGDNICLEIKRGTFDWVIQDKREETKMNEQAQNYFSLQKVNLIVKKGQFAALIGEFGSGKSSLLNAILGEMNCSEGSVAVKGSVAYADQNPWILNDTVRNNILFGEQFNEKQYQTALYYSQLQTDLSLFADGDGTIIGERGSTLSGGQRARISLARALYKNADIYLLDDVLSALDAQVTAAIFRQTFVEYLKGKTIILATHLLNYLNLAHNVYCIDKGIVSQVIVKDPNSKRIISQLASVSKNVGFNDLLAQSQEQICMTQSQPSSQAAIYKQNAQIDEQIYQLDLFILFINRRGGKIYAIITIIFSILIISENMITFKWFNNWLNAPDGNEFYYYGIFIMILILTSFRIIAYQIVEYSTSLFLSLHNIMIKKLMIAPMMYFQTVSSSSILNKLSNDLTKVDNLIIPKFKNTIVDFSLALSFIFNVVLSYLETGQYLISIWILLSISLIGYFYYFFMVSLKKIHRLDRQCQISVFGCFSQIISGLTTIRAFQKENYMKEKQKQCIRNYKKVSNVKAGVQAYFIAVVSVLTAITTILIFVKILIFHQKESLIDYFVVYNMFSFEKSINLLHVNLSEFLNNLKYLGYCDQLTKIPQEEGYALISKGENDFDFGKEVDSSWIQRGQIDFNQFSVRYRPQLEDVLKEITLNIRPGEKIGVVGRTGSGKSTTIMSLLRMLQTHSGNITIDGKDIYARDLQSLRAGFSVILQEHFLFSGTVRENIDPLNVFADSDIIAALQRCGLWESLNSRNGLLTSVEEGGDNFSGGERQLINIARTLLDPKKVVLVDEATASIDYKSDEMLQKVIRDQFASCTVITIAHRITTILTSDRILVLDKGRIVELDSPQNLLKDPNSAFFKLYKESRLSHSSTDFQL